jgi:hypothetical protein
LTAIVFISKGLYHPLQHTVPLSPLAEELFKEAITRRRQRDSAFV